MDEPRPTPPQTLMFPDPSDRTGTTSGASEPADAAGAPARASAANQSVWAVSTQVLLLLAGLLSSILLNRLLESAGRGVVALVTLWPTILAYLVVAGWTPAIASRVSRQPDSGRRLWAAWTSAGGALSLAVMAAGWFLVPLVLPDLPELWIVARGYLLFILFTVLGLPAVAVLEGLGRFDLTARVRLLAAACAIPLIVGAAWLSVLSPQSYLVILIGTTFLVNAYAVLLMARATCGTWTPRFFGTGDYVWRAAPLGWVQVVQGRVDQVLVALLAPIDEAAFGAFVAGTAMGSLVTAVATGLSSVLLPESARRSGAQAVDVYCGMGRAYVLVSVAVSIPLFVAAEWVLTLAYGSDFARGAAGFRASLARSLVVGLHGMAISTFQGMNRPGLATLSGLLGFGASVGAGALLLPHVGYAGTVCGQMVGGALGLLLLYPALRGYGFSPLRLIPRRQELGMAVALAGRLASRAGARVRCARRATR